jgi:hypothetical protein
VAFFDRTAQQLIIYRSRSEADDYQAGLNGFFTK